MHFSKVTSLQICILTKFSIANHLINNVCQEIKYDELAKLFGGDRFNGKKVCGLFASGLSYSTACQTFIQKQRESIHIYSAIEWLLKHEQ